ncbi:glucosaminidase domain-containing protein [Candidatus Saccharibacteria bacterium]|nr:glucosaminidase domain-containing protein [Candidatus Saccharibacteria bacterium]
MNKRAKKILLYPLILICCSITPLTTAHAEGYSVLKSWSNSKLKHYAEDNILYYDSEFGCEEFYDDGRFITKPDDNLVINNSGDVWDGHCDGIRSYDTWITTHIDDIISIARANGLPWEAIMAQTIKESSGGRREACPYNPLGLKVSTKSNHPYCDERRHASFNSYKEAFQYYVDIIAPVRESKNKFPNDPYKYAYYIQHRDGSHYATDPNYTNSLSGFICGVQKWAESNPQYKNQLSAKTYADYPNGLTDNPSPSNPNPEPEPETPNPNNPTSPGEKARYNKCKKEAEDTTPNGDVSALQALVKEWAWPEYHSPKFTTLKPAYAAVIATSAHKGGWNEKTGESCPGVDCGAFVYNLIHESGWDPNYPATSTGSLKHRTGQIFYLKNNWQEIGNAAVIPESDLQPGDVAIKEGHVFIYVGEIPGFSSHTASASLCQRAPMAGKELTYSTDYLKNFTWFRKR